MNAVTPDSASDSASSLPRAFAPAALAVWFLLFSLCFLWLLHTGRWLTLLSGREVPSFTTDHLRWWAYLVWMAGALFRGAGLATLLHAGARLLKAKRAWLPFIGLYLVLQALWACLSTFLHPGLVGRAVLFGFQAATAFGLVKVYYRQPWGPSFGIMVLAGTLAGALLIPYTVAKSVSALIKQPWSSLVNSPVFLRTDREADPEYVLQALDGSRVMVGDLRDRALVVTFWSSDSLPSRMQLPSLERLYKAVRPLKNVQCLLVSEQGESALRKFAQGSVYDLPLFFATAPRPDSFAAKSLPATFLVSRDGQVVAVHEGSARWDAEPVIRLVRELGDTEPGQPLPPDFDRLPIEPAPAAGDASPASTLLQKRAETLLSQGDLAGAQKLLDKAFVLRQRYGRQDMDFARLLYVIGNAHYQQHHWSVAEAYYKQALRMAQQLKRTDDPDLGNYYNALACAYYSQGRGMEAQVLQERAIELAEKDKAHPERLALFLRNDAKTLRLLERVKEAEKLEKRAAHLASR